MSAYRLYSKSGCPSCVRAKQALDDAGIDYEVVDLSEDEHGDARRQAFYDEKRFVGRERCVPKLFEKGLVGESLIGGEAAIKDYLADLV